MQHGLTYRAPSLKSRLYKYRWLYLFLLPAIIWYVIFAYGPIYGLQIAFKDFKILKPYCSAPVPHGRPRAACWP